VSIPEPKEAVLVRHNNVTIQELFKFRLMRQLGTLPLSKTFKVRYLFNSENDNKSKEVMMNDFSTHILGSFRDALQNLRNDVLMMSSLTERGLTHAAKGLFERDDEACNIAIADDEEIDLLEIQVDREGVDILMRYHPVASDLRHVVTAMKSSVNIERIADQNVNIARRARKLSKGEIPSIVSHLQPMFTLAHRMFSDAIRAYSDGDHELARSLKPRDRELDLLNQSFADECTRLMEAEPKAIREYLNLIFIARFVERIGDHASNIGEDIVFAVSAEEIRHTIGKPVDEA
jgi:phosphate transport system protein